MTIHWGDGTTTTTHPSGGKIVQVTSSDFTTQASHGGTTFSDSGVTCSITPTSSSNDIIVNYSINYSSTGNCHSALRLMRGSTAINIATFGDSNQVRATSGGYIQGNRMYTCSGSFVDSPSTTSAIAYHIELRTNNGTMYVNRNRYTQNAGYSLRGASHMCLMEVS